jgi:hypothetical protein
MTPRSSSLVDNDGLVDLVGQFADGTLDVYVNTSTLGNPQFGIQKQIGVEPSQTSR